MDEHAHDLVSIVIPTYNGLKNLKKCLYSIVKNTDYPYYEIIVVDNASSDGTYNFLKKNFPNIRVVVNKKNVGNAEGINVGVRSAKGNFVMILDNDIEVTKGWLRELVKLAKSNPSIGVCGSLPFWYDYRRYAPIYEGCFQVSTVSGAAMLLKKDVIKKVGLCDPSYFAYFEDTELCWRHILFGYKVVYDSDSVVLHKGGQTSKRMNLSFITFHSTKNRLTTIIKIFGFRSLTKILFFEAIRLPLAFLFALFSKRTLTTAYFISVFWVLWHMRDILQKRAEIQERRMVSDDVILRLRQSEREMHEFFLEKLLQKMSEDRTKDDFLKDNIVRRLYATRFFKKMGFPLD